MSQTKKNKNGNARPSPSDRMKLLAEEAVAAAAMHPPGALQRPHPGHPQMQSARMLKIIGGVGARREVPYTGTVGLHYFQQGVPMVLKAGLPPPTTTTAAGGGTVPLSTTSTIPSAISSDAKRKAVDDALAQRRSKAPRPSPANEVIDLSTDQDQPTSSTGSGASKTASELQHDPPGFAAFQRDPSFISSIMNCRMRNNGSNDKLLGPLSQGLVKLSDDDIFNLSNEENSSSIKNFVTGVIMPLLGIDDQIASNLNVWQGYAHISSEGLLSVAKNFFYLRRCSMKAAVQVAFFEMKKNHDKILEAAKLNKKKNEANDVKLTKKIQQLEKELKKQREDSAKMTKEIEQVYEKDIANMRNDFKLHVEGLKKTHKEEVEEVKKQMEDMKWSHKQFLESYVEAAAEAVHLAQKQGKASLGKAISDV